MKHNTMRLTAAPSEIATRVRRSWNAIFEAYGFETFHPIEAKGVLMASIGIRRDEAERILTILVDREFAATP